MAHAVASGKSMEDFSGENPDAAPIDSLAAAALRCVYSDCLSAASNAVSGYILLCGLLHTAGCIVRSDSWSENANADMDKRTDAHQAERTGHTYLIRRHGLHGSTVCRLSAPARMDAWVYWIYGRLYRGKCDFMHMRLPVASKNRNRTIQNPVMPNEKARNTDTVFWLIKS